jgi:hypothetical protein
LRAETSAIFAASSHVALGGGDGVLFALFVSVLAFGLEFVRRHAARAVAADADDFAVRRELGVEGVFADVAQ